MGILAEWDSFPTIDKDLISEAFDKAKDGYWWALDTYTLYLTDPNRTNTLDPEEFEAVFQKFLVNKNYDWEKQEKCLLRTLKEATAEERSVTRARTIARLARNRASKRKSADFEKYQKSVVESKSPPRVDKKRRMKRKKKIEVIQAVIFTSQGERQKKEVTGDSGGKTRNCGTLASEDSKGGIDFFRERGFG